MAARAASPGTTVEGKGIQCSLFLTVSGFPHPFRSLLADQQISIVAEGWVWEQETSLGVAGHPGQPAATQTPCSTKRKILGLWK